MFGWAICLAATAASAVMLVVVKYDVTTWAGWFQGIGALLVLLVMLFQQRLEHVRQEDRAEAERRQLRSSASMAVGQVVRMLDRDLIEAHVFDAARFADDPSYASAVLQAGRMLRDGTAYADALTLLQSLPHAALGDADVAPALIEARNELACLMLPLRSVGTSLVQGKSPSRDDLEAVVWHKGRLGDCHGVLAKTISKT